MPSKQGRGHRAANPLCQSHIQAATATLTPTRGWVLHPGRAWKGKCSNLFIQQNSNKKSKYLGFFLVSDYRTKILLRSHLAFIFFPYVFQNNTVGATQEGGVANRSSVWICNWVTSAPSQLQAQGNVANWQLVPILVWHQRGTVSLQNCFLEDFRGILPRGESWHQSPRASKGHQAPPPPRLGPLHLLPPSTLRLLCQGCVLCPVPLHGGYLGTGQSGKHLIATLRRGDVRNKGNCVGSWELPFPGNSDSQTKPWEAAASPPAKLTDTNKPPSKRHACGVQNPRLQRQAGPPAARTSWECPTCQRGHCAQSVGSRGSSGALRSADSTVASCRLSCISIIFGEAPLFSIILISVNSANSIVLPVSGWPEYKIFQSQNILSRKGCRESMCGHTHTYSCTPCQWVSGRWDKKGQLSYSI